jgi:hypothetical protein
MPKKFFLNVSTLKDENITLHRKVGAQLSSDAASYRGRTGSLNVILYHIPTHLFDIYDIY